MKKFKDTFLKLIKDESGQGATEYILLLVVVVAIALLFKKEIKSIVDSKIGEIRGNIGNFTIE